MTTYSKHALDRMRLRGISTDDVEAALRNCVGDPEPGSRPDTLVMTGYTLDRRLLNVVVDSVQTDHVVTTYER
jgi:hypothetical protein